MQQNLIKKSLKVIYSNFYSKNHFPKKIVSKNNFPKNILKNKISKLNIKSITQAHKKKVPCAGDLTRLVLCILAR